MCQKCLVDNYRGFEWAHEAIAAGSGFRIWFDNGEEIEEKQIIANGPNKLAQTLRLMHNEYPRHYGDLVSGNEDAETGDVFFQLLCFGEIVYA